MQQFARYAIYHLPQDEDLARFGARWLGWDIRTGAAAPQPNVAGLADCTRRARRYGFHATLKPPFRLANGATSQALADAVARFAARAKPAAAPGLRLATLGRFLALVPDGSTDAVDNLAFDCVRSFDEFRRPLTPAELAERSKPHLTPTQREMLNAWGYPHVGPAFRFHMTLTDRLGEAQRAGLEATLRRLMPPLPAPFQIALIALVGEDALGQFHLVEEYALTGS